MDQRHSGKPPVPPSSLRRILNYFSFTRCFYALLGILLATSIAAFLLYVHLWSILPTVLVSFGMLLTFLLGAGSRTSTPAWRGVKRSRRGLEVIRGRRTASIV